MQISTCRFPDGSISEVATHDTVEKIVVESWNWIQYDQYFENRFCLIKNLLALSERKIFIGHLTKY